MAKVKIAFAKAHKTKEKRMTFDISAFPNQPIYEKEIDDYVSFINWLINTRFTQSYIPKQKEKWFNRRKVLVVFNEDMKYEYYFFRPMSDFGHLYKHEYLNDDFEDHSFGKHGE